MNGGDKVYDRGRGNNLPEALDRRRVTITMKEKCPECGENIDVAEDGSFHCHCGNIGIFEVGVKRK